MALKDEIRCVNFVIKFLEEQLDAMEDDDDHVYDGNDNYTKKEIKTYLNYFLSLKNKLLEVIREN